MQDAARRAPILRTPPRFQPFILRNTPERRRLRDALPQGQNTPLELRTPPRSEQRNITPGQELFFHGMSPAPDQHQRAEHRPSPIPMARLASPRRAARGQGQGRRTPQQVRAQVRRRLLQIRRDQPLNVRFLDDAFETLSTTCNDAQKRKPTFRRIEASFLQANRSITSVARTLLNIKAKSKTRQMAFNIIISMLNTYNNDPTLQTADTLRCQQTIMRRLLSDTNNLNYASDQDSRDFRELYARISGSADLEAMRINLETAPDSRPKRAVAKLFKTVGLRIDR